MELIYQSYQIESNFFSGFKCEESEVGTNTDEYNALINYGLKTLPFQNRALRFNKSPELIWGLQGNLRYLKMHI